MHKWDTKKLYRLLIIAYLLVMFIIIVHVLYSAYVYMYLLEASVHVVIRSTKQICGSWNHSLNGAIVINRSYSSSLKPIMIKLFEQEQATYTSICKHVQLYSALFNHYSSQSGKSHCSFIYINQPSNQLGSGKTNLCDKRVFSPALVKIAVNTMLLPGQLEQYWCSWHWNMSKWFHPKYVARVLLNKRKQAVWLCWLTKKAISLCPYSLLWCISLVLAAVLTSDWRGTFCVFRRWLQLVTENTPGSFLYFLVQVWMVRMLHVLSVGV